MRHFRGEFYITLKEWLTMPNHSLPLGLTTMTVAGPVPFSAADLFSQRYGRRYIAEPIDPDGGSPTEFPYRLTSESARIYAHYKPLIEGVAKMLSDLYADTTRETVEQKRAPSGGVDFESAFADGGTVRKLSGQNSANVDRIIRAEAELRDLYDQMLNEYEILFISARWGWGCDHGGTY